MRRVVSLLAVVPCFLGGLAPAEAADGDVFSSWSVSSATLNPTVDDGVRDAVHVSWQSWSGTGTNTSVTVTVTRDSDGSVVESLDFAADESDDWAWRGTNDDGDTVTPGDYTVSLRGTTDGGAFEQHDSVVSVIDPGVCRGVSRCSVKARADVNGDGAEDAVAVAGRGSGADREIIVRVKTGPGLVVGTRRPAPYWYGSLWQGTAGLDGRPGKEVVVGQSMGAHTQLYRALTWLDDRLVTLDAPGSARYWTIDGAVWISVGWLHRSTDPAGTIRKRSAVRTGDALRSPFKGTVTTFRWNGTGWTRVASTTRRVSDRTAFSWGGFHVRGLPRW